jgi:thiazole synthase
MARAIALGVAAGGLARAAGRIERRTHAVASTPDEGRAVL